MKIASSPAYGNPFFRTEIASSAQRPAKPEVQAEAPASSPQHIAPADGMVAGVNAVIDGGGTELRLNFDRNFNQVVANVVDKETSTVILRLPTETYLQVARCISRTGSLIHQVA
jgi:uncharacterized FlaG/YvyC family protein